MSGIRIRIPFNKAYIFPECYDAVKEACDMGKLSGDGINSKRCIEWFHERFEYERCLLTPSCTAALEMAALILDLQPGDEVLCPSFTFVSTANAFALRGAKIIFADSERDTSCTPNMSVAHTLSKITPNTKAIVVVHYAGIPIDLTALVATGIPLIEDCAHAIGSIDPVTNKPIGQQGCMSCFSFHETKNIAIGEGGMLVVNDATLWEKAQVIREKGTNRTRFLEGKDAFYTWTSLGSSYLLSEADAGILWGCLQNFDALQSRRHEVWNTYDKKLFPSTIFDRQSVQANAHMYYLTFSNEVDPRTNFCKHMKEKGILVATHYLPLDTSPYMKQQRQQEQEEGDESIDTCTRSATWSKSLVRLPLYYEFPPALQQEVVDAVNEYSVLHGWVICSPTTNDHIEAIRVIRNSQSKSFWDVGMIDADTHKAFMANHACNYRVCVSNNTVIGFIGQVRGDLRLAVSHDFMGEGVGKFMFDNFCEEYPSFTLKVRQNNLQSLKFFSKLGWEPNPAAAEEDPVPLTRKAAT